MCESKRERVWYEFPYPCLQCRTCSGKSQHPPDSAHGAWGCYLHPRNTKCPTHGPGLTSPNKRSQKATCAAKTPQPKQTEGPVLSHKCAFWCTLSDQTAAAATGMLQGQAAARSPLPGTASAPQGSARRRLAPGAATLQQGLSELLELLSIKTQIRFTGSCCSARLSYGTPSPPNADAAIGTECISWGVSFEPPADTATFPTPAFCLHPGLC